MSKLLVRKAEKDNKKSEIGTKEKDGISPSIPDNNTYNLHLFSHLYIAIYPVNQAITLNFTYHQSTFLLIGLQSIDFFSYLCIIIAEQATYLTPKN